MTSSAKVVFKAEPKTMKSRDFFWNLWFDRESADCLLFRNLKFKFKLKQVLWTIWCLIELEIWRKRSIRIGLGSGSRLKIEGERAQALVWWLTLIRPRLSWRPSPRAHCQIGYLINKQNRLGLHQLVNGSTCPWYFLLYYHRRNEYFQRAKTT